MKTILENLDDGYDDEMFFSQKLRLKHQEI